MNLNEERNYQKLMDALDALRLSEENRKTADIYFSQSEGKEAEILKQVKPQDLSELPEEDQNKSISYIEHLKKRGKKEELSRYVRFVAAAGGSTARYALFHHVYMLKDLQEYLPSDQSLAIRAEALVWNMWTLSWMNIKELVRPVPDNLKLLRQAMSLCCHKYDNAKVLLSALYLNEKKKKEENQRAIQQILGRHFSSEGSEEREIIGFLIKNLVSSLPAVFQSPGLNEEEKKMLQDYVVTGNPQGSFPQDLAKVLTGKQTHQYLLTLLSGCAFLALPYSKSFPAFLQIMAAANPADTMNACRQMSEDAWFQEHASRLEWILPVSTGFFVQWYMKNRVDGRFRHMISCAQDLVLEEMEKGTTTTEDYQYIMEQIRKTDPVLYRKADTAVSGTFYQKLADELTGGLTAGREEAKRYLLGEGSIDDLYPYVNSWRGGYGYFYQGMKQLDSMEKGGGLFYRRAVVLEALKMRGGYFVYHYLPRGKDAGKLNEKVEELVKMLEEEDVPIQYQADAMEGIYSGYYSETDKNHFMEAAVEALSRRFQARRQEFCTALKNSTAVGRDICLRVLDTYWQQEKETILACALDGSRQVRAALVLICTGHPQWEPEIRAFLSSGKSQEREIAVQVMRNWGVENYREELAEALEKEKSKKLKELLRECLGAEPEGEEAVPAKEQSAEKMVSEILKGGKKRKVAWAYETPFGQVHKRDGSAVPEEYLQALLVCYADMSVPGVSPEAALLAAELDEKELGQYVKELFDKWMDAGAEAKKKWVLYAAAIHGGEAVVPLFHRQIQEWPQHSRGALAAEAVKALALNGSSEALLLVDQISRKFKFRQVKTAAAQALDYAATALGISRAELEDRIVPTLGFDENLERTFDYGSRSFRVYLTPALELEIFDGEDKRLKNMPSPGKKDDPEKAAEAYADFKQLKKQLKTVAANQKLRMEQAMSAERLWNVAQWKALFIKNPVMHQFAIGLIWGIYENGSLKETFRYMEDGSFNTVDEEEYDFPEEGMAGLVHPIELSEEERNAWKEQLADYEVTQPIEQLDRPVYRIQEEEKGKNELTRFGGKLLNGLSLSGKLQSMGWYRGSVQDAGVYTDFYREDGNLGVELEFSGSYVGDENEEVTVYGAVFYKAGTVARGSYVYDTVKDENRYTLDQVPPRYFSEIILQLARATASSQEQLAYPECRQ